MASQLIKGPAPAPASFPGASGLRVGIVHARWNKEAIDALVKGAVESLGKAGIAQENILIDSVPGSWELPMGVQKYVSARSVREGGRLTWQHDQPARGGRCDRHRRGDQGLHDAL